MSSALSAAGQVWPAFVLVAGLLLVGVVAAADGLFSAAGALVARLPLGPRGLLVAALGLCLSGPFRSDSVLRWAGAVSSRS